MKRLPDSTLNIQDVPRLFSKYWLSIALSSIIGASLFMAIAYQLPKKYKAHFVLTIYSKYFQSPLIGDFVPELGESGEMRSQRESLILQVLTPEYIDSLAHKYGIYSDSGTQLPPSSRLAQMIADLRTWAQSVGIVPIPNADSKLSREREELRARIDIFSLNSTTFNVGFMYSDPNIAFGVTKDLYTQIIQELLSVRMNILENVRDAIQKRLDLLGGSIQQTAVNSDQPPSPSQILEKQLAEVRRQLHTLEAQYTDEHPLVIQMKEKQSDLESQLASAMQDEQGAGPSKAPARTGLESGTKDGSRDIYSDLLRKLNYLNIAIDSDREHQNDYFATLEAPLFPSSPLWPKKTLMACYGFALGLISSLFLAALREYFDRSRLHTSALAQQLDVTLLGSLPAFPQKANSQHSGERPDFIGRS